MRRLRHRLSRLRRRMLFEDLLVAESCIGGGAHGFPVTDEPVWLLGTRYCTRLEGEALLEDFRSRLWMTYRRGFSPIGGDGGPTSDRGWGCMLRCGQMLLAEALTRQSAGRRWRWSPDARDDVYLKTVAQFADREQAQYSIHQIALVGERTARKPIGTWFGPNTVAQALRHVPARGTCCTPVLHVAMDSCVVRSEVRRACAEASGGPWRRPLLLLVPLRLGLSELNPVYIGGVKSCFTIPHSIGIIGGTPNHALYFVGCVGDRLVYLDPHTTQQAAEVGRKRSDSEREADLSYHCEQPSFMKITAMDPSVAVAFLCQSEEEFESLCQHIQKILIDNEKHPMFELREKPPDWQDDSASCLGTDAAAAFDFDGPELRAAVASDGGDTDDEFVVL